MPMPPPKPSTEAFRDRHVAHEVKQIVRALEVNGPLQHDELQQVVGATYWESDRFDRALAFAVQDGFVHRVSDGSLAAT